MKKICLIAFLFNLALSNLVGQISAESLSPLSFADKISEKIKLDFPFLQAKVYGEKNNIIWETDLLLDNKKNAFLVKTGNLSFSDEASKINNPQLSSSVSPFWQVDISSKLINADCTSSSFSKPFSVFSQYSYTAPNKNKFSVNAFYTPDYKNFSFSSELIWNCTNIVLTKKETSTNTKLLFINFSGGIFSYDELTSDSWFLPQKYYSKGFQKAFAFTEGLEAENYKIDIKTSLYTTPQNRVRCTVQSDLLFKIQKNIFSLSIFCNPQEPFFTPGKTTVSKQLQLKTNFQREIKIKKMTIKSGLSFYDKIDFNSTKQAMQFSGGINLSNKKYSGTISSDVKINKADFFKVNMFNIKTTNNFSNDIFGYSINLTAIFLPSETISQWQTEQTISFSIKLKLPVSLSINLSGDIKEKEHSISSLAFEYGATISYKKNFFTGSVTFADKVKIK